MIAWLFSAAWAGELQGSLAADMLHASTQSTDVGSGPEEGLSATELGVRLRSELFEVDDRLEVGLDYRGREPVAGDFPTTARRVLYRLDADFVVVDDRLTLGVGRFLVPAAVFLAVDGGRAEVGLDDAMTLTVYGGRRAISTSLVPIPVDTQLPAAGLSLVRGTDSYRGELAATYAGDRLSLGTAETPYDEDYRAASGFARLWWRPIPTLDLGGQGSLAQRASYQLVSVADDPIVAVEGLDVTTGLLWSAWRPTEITRVQADGVHQRALVSREAFEDRGLVDPSFTDLRVRPAVRALDRAWLGGDARLRVRDDRTELRYGGSIDIDDLGVPGLFTRAMLQIDDVFADDSGQDLGAVDRLLWRASAGYSKGGLDLEVGASFIDRASGPVSGRSVSPVDPGVPGSSTDLSPFVLQAQNIVFARAFASSRQWFLGGDLEANVEDVPEIRALLQVGALMESRW